MIHLHKHTNGTFFILAERGYYTIMKANNNPGAKFIISGLHFWYDIKGIVPMGDCLALKPTCQAGIFMFMQCNMVIPISFVDN